ncbi:Ku domain-containing protein [Mycena kentingensis (nom. inval.)]|nr:Ku domain-containing protein [Mycena kentingensis (nom. inval.)]
MAERAGYSVTMFVVDVGPSMATVRTHDYEGNELAQPLTNLEWGLQFVKLKIQEMIYNGRKTDKCGVILMGSDKTRNKINKIRGEGYERIQEYIAIDTPTPDTLVKLNRLKATDEPGDAFDALIVAMEAQQDELKTKRTWTRKIVIVTDADAPIEIDDQLDPIVRKMNEYAISLTVVGIDFDSEDEAFPYTEESKSNIKRKNEEFYHEFVDALDNGVVGTCAYALREIARPDVKITKSVMSATTLIMGDMDARPDEAFIVNVRTSKCTAQTRPKSFKKWTMREALSKEQKAALAKKPKVKMEDEDDSATEDEDEDEDEEVEETPANEAKFIQPQRRTEYFVDHRESKDEDPEPAVKKEEGEEDEPAAPETDKLIKTPKEDLIRGYKYGTTYVPALNEDGFDKLPTKRGLELCGFFPAKNFRREHAMGEVYYIWGDPKRPLEQVAMSSIAQGMYEKGVMGIARWVSSKDGSDAKMGVVIPGIADGVDYLMWTHMPFADDVRKYKFSSLDNLVSRTGAILDQHPYLPTETQVNAMDKFVDCMDLMHASDEKDDDGERLPWFDTRLSFNPAVHRIKHAQFHAAVTGDLNNNPVPPPHPELMTYFEPPKRVLKRARAAIDECKDEFNVKAVPKKVAKTKAHGHAHAQDDDGETLLLPSTSKWANAPEPVMRTASAASPTKNKAKANGHDSDEEDEDVEMQDASKSNGHALGSGRSSPAATVADVDDSNSMDVVDASLGIDAGRAPGRIIGTARPLADFKETLSRGDMVSKAVEDMCAVISELVVKPFASRRHAELMECMVALRHTCLHEDEIEAWNEFLPDLKKALIESTPGNKEFWGEIQKVGRPMSLISEPEAEKLGGEADPSESKAKKFLL